MAYTEVQSNEIPEDTQYYSGKLPLGDYNFYLQYDAATATVVTRCDFPDGIQGATQRKLPIGAKVRQWSIEANETEASVYALVEPGEAPDTGPIQPPIATAKTGTVTRAGETFVNYVPGGLLTQTAEGAGGALLCASDVYGTEWWGIRPEGSLNDRGNCTDEYTYNGKTVYYDYSSGGYSNVITAASPNLGVPIKTLSQYAGPVAWIMIYGNEPPQIGSKLVARFKINLGDAGGYPGGGGGWTQPGDWNPDPTTTLHLTVNGALSGRHNDPLEHPIYSYLPADNTSQAGYGCGGDGGHGGGGGGGASTIIVRQFATNKANSKDIVTIAKRHGYGSGAGKGAKGGDGCILVYY